MSIIARLFTASRNLGKAASCYLGWERWGVVVSVDVEHWPTICGHDCSEKSYTPLTSHQALIARIHRYFTADCGLREIEACILNRNMGVIEVNWQGYCNRAGHAGKPLASH